MTSKVFGDVCHHPNNDILSCLIDVLPDSDLLSLAQTCRHILKLSRSVLNVRKLQARYSHVLIMGLVHLGELADELEVSSDAIRHIQTITYADDRFANGYNLANEENAKRIETELTNQLPHCEALMNVIQSVQHDQLGPDRKAVFKLCAIVSFCAICPNLKSIAIRDDAFIPAKYLHRVIKYLSMEIPKPDASPLVPRSAAGRLSKLKQIRLVASSFGPNSIPYTSMACLTSIPTLQEINLSGMRIESNREEVDADAITNFATSNVKRIIFDTPFTEAETLGSLIKHLPKLQYVRLSGIDSLWRVLGIRYMNNNRLGADDPRLEEISTDIEGCDNAGFETKLYLRELRRAIDDGIKPPLRCSKVVACQKVGPQLQWDMVTIELFMQGRHGQEEKNDRP